MKRNVVTVKAAKSKAKSAAKKATKKAAAPKAAGPSKKSQIIADLKAAGAKGVLRSKLADKYTKDAKNPVGALGMIFGGIAKDNEGKTVVKTVGRGAEAVVSLARA